MTIRVESTTMVLSSAEYTVGIGQPVYNALHQTFYNPHCDDLELKRTEILAFVSLLSRQQIGLID